MSLVPGTEAQEEGRHSGASSATAPSRDGLRNRVQLPLNLHRSR